jgi:hypothetical protein
VLAGFTAALVVVTARYVTQTKNLVSETQKSREEAERAREQSAEESRLTREEMRASREESRMARELSVLPKLAIEIETIGEGMVVGLKLANVGQGPAFEVEVTIAFEPVEGGSLPRDERPWRTKILARDEWLRFMPPYDEQGDILRVPALGQAYKEVTVTGRMRDALGQEHDVGARERAGRPSRADDRSHGRRREGPATRRASEAAQVLRERDQKAAAGSP